MSNVRHALSRAARCARSVALVVGLAGVSLLVAGCWGSSAGSGNYCQSGPKYGTQCYYVNDRNEAQPIPNRQPTPTQTDTQRPPPKRYR